MTRPKVPPEARQRIAQACDSCKRRKQKVLLDRPHYASASVFCNARCLMTIYQHVFCPPF